MRVTKRVEKGEVDFATLKPGDCFEKWGHLYVKSRANEGATGLADGEARVNMRGIYVIPCNAEVHIIG